MRERQGEKTEETKEGRRDRGKIENLYIDSKYLHSLKTVFKMKS